MVIMNAVGAKQKIKICSNLVLTLRILMSSPNISIQTLIFQPQFHTRVTVETFVLYTAAEFLCE